MNRSVFTIVLCLWLLSSSEAIQVTRKVLVIGPAGAGKSSMIRNLLHSGFTLDEYKAPDAHLNPNPVTREMTEYTGILETSKFSIDLTLWDTMGFGSSDNITNILRDIFYTMKYEPAVHLIIVLAKLERKNPDAINGVLSVLSTLKRYGATNKNVRVYLTHADFYSSAIQNVFVEDAREQLASVFDVKPEVGCFVNVDDMNEAFHDALLEKRNADVQRLAQTISDASSPFSPQRFWMITKDCEQLCRETVDKQRWWSTGPAPSCSEECSYDPIMVLNKLQEKPEL